MNLRPLDPQICERGSSVSAGDWFLQVKMFREHQRTVANTPVLKLVGVPIGVRRRNPRSNVSQRPRDREDCKLTELGEGPGPASGRDLVFESLPERTTERADSGSCPAATGGGRGEAGHPAKDPWRPPGDQLNGAIRSAHRCGLAVMPSLWRSDDRTPRPP